MLTCNIFFSCQRGKVEVMQAMYLPVKHYNMQHAVMVEDMYACSVTPLALQND